MRSTLSRLALALGSLFLFAAGCEPKQGYGPSLEEAVAEEHPWPVCISQQMRQRAAACPAIQRTLSSEPTVCVPQASAAWPTAPPVIEPDALRASFKGRSAATDRADDLFRQALEDPTTSKRARQAYQRILRRPSAADPSWGYAAYKLGLLEGSIGDTTAALASFEKAVRFAMDRPSTPHAATLEAAAREALVSSQAQSDDVFAAAERFARVAGVRNDRRRVAMSARLAERLVSIGKLADAEDVLATLAAGSDYDRCLHRIRLVRVRDMLGKRAGAERALEELMDDLRTLPSDHRLRDRCGAEGAQLALSLGEHWQAESLATHDSHAMHLASEVYRGVLETFSQRSLDAWGVCSQLSDVAYGRAELLFAQRRWAECGGAYDLAIRFDPRGERAEDAAFSAVVCRKHTWDEAKRAQQNMRDIERMAGQLEHSEDWRLLLGSIHRFMCIANESQRDTPDYAESAFARGQAFYDGGALWEAAVIFRLVAFEQHQGDAPVHAAQRYAEVMEDLAADDACRQELTRDVDELANIHCSGNAASDACSGLRAVLSRLSARRPQL